MSNPFDRIKQAKAAYDAEVKNAGKEAFREFFAGIFSANPDILGVRWTQYTPHFNDGEPCEFGVYFRGIQVRDDDSADGGDDGDGFLSSYDFDKEDHRKAIARQIENEIESLDDVCEAAFGDGVMVTVTRDGIEVESYDHD